MNIVEMKRVPLGRPDNYTNRGKGRPKGSRNKTTALIKDAILMAGDEVGLDGAGKERMVGYLKRLAVEHPPAFAMLLAKVLPLQVTGMNGEAIKVEATVSPADRLRKLMCDLAEPG